MDNITELNEQDRNKTVIRFVFPRRNSKKNTKNGWKIRFKGSVRKL